MSKLVALLLLLAPAVAMADVIDQPAADYIRGQQFFHGETLLQYSYDLNQDGRPDYLISQSSMAQDRGGAQWSVYLSLPGKRGYTMAGVAVLEADQVQIVEGGEFGDTVAIVAFFPAGGGQGSVVAYRFHGTQFEMEKLGFVHSRPEDETPEDRALTRRYFANAKTQQVEVVGLDTVMPKSQVDALPDEETDFFHANNFISDPLYPNQSLVYDKKSGKLIGYSVGGEFIPISEAKAHGLPETRDPVAERKLKQ